ncbi:MAG: hydroxysqualene dehydroxylase HpnE [Phycisphaerales bacterium]
MSQRTDIVIAGGGIAGIAAGIRLAQAGAKVVVVETRKKLGGRATSFVDVRTGQTLDNCQHVALRCCTNYLDLLERLGVIDEIEWHDRQFWIERGGRTSVVKRSFLPAPTHFSPSVAMLSFLSLNEKRLLAQCMLAIMRVDRSQWVTRTFGEFLSQHGQTDRLIRRFWEPVIVSACNLGVARAAASSALQVFQEGFCAARTSADIGIARVPLVMLYDSAEAVLARAGGELRLGTSVRSIGEHKVTVSSGVGPDESLLCDRVICALPPERVGDVMDPQIVARDPRMGAMARITHSPILGVHLRFDRPVLLTPHAVLVEGSVQWLFRKDDEGTSIHAVISGADEWMPLSEAEITQRVLADLHAYLPGSAGATLLSSRPVKEKRATFACTPEVEQIRPPVAAPRGESEILLAGDAVQTGWPATMEGATRSGYMAAAVVLGKEPRGLLVPDVAPAPLARAFGLRGQTKAIA